MVMAMMMVVADDDDEDDGGDGGYENDTADGDGDDDGDDDDGGDDDRTQRYNAKHMHKHKHHHHHHHHPGTNKALLCVSFGCMLQMKSITNTKQSKINQRANAQLKTIPLTMTPKMAPRTKPLSGSSSFTNWNDLLPLPPLGLKILLELLPGSSSPVCLCSLLMSCQCNCCLHVQPSQACS